MVTTEEVMMSFLVGYRTYIAAFLVAVFGALAQTDWIAILDNPSAGWTAIFSAILIAVFRTITTTPPGKKPDTQNGEGQ
jgi:hypothetical protein